MRNQKCWLCLSRKWMMKRTEKSTGSKQDSDEKEATKEALADFLDKEGE